MKTNECRIKLYGKKEKIVPIEDIPQIISIIKKMMSDDGIRNNVSIQNRRLDDFV